MTPFLIDSWALVLFFCLRTFSAADYAPVGQLLSARYNTSSYRVVAYRIVLLLNEDSGRRLCCPARWSRLVRLWQAVKETTSGGSTTSSGVGSSGGPASVPYHVDNDDDHTQTEQLVSACDNVHQLSSTRR